MLAQIPADLLKASCSSASEIAEPQRSCASSFDSDFIYETHAAYTKEQWESGALESNDRPADLRPSVEDRPGLDDFASGTGKRGPA